MQPYFDFFPNWPSKNVIFLVTLPNETYEVKFEFPALLQPPEAVQIFCSAQQASVRSLLVYYISLVRTSLSFNLEKKLDGPAA